MNNNYENVDPDLRIGSACWFMNISAILEYNNVLPLSLVYTNFDFLYNKESFTKFNLDKEPQEYVSGDDELIITQKVNSVYTEDFGKYNQMTIGNLNQFDIEITKRVMSDDLHYLKEEFLDKNMLLQISFDHYYAIEDYRKVFPQMMHFHTNFHKALLVDIDFANDEAYIIDKFYRYKGKISIATLMKCMNSEHLGSKEYYICKNINYEKIDNNDKVIQLFKDNIKITLEKEIMINGRMYKKNIEAIKAFKDDIREILMDLYSTKEKYAPQFFTQIVKPIILQKLSFHNLMTYLNKNILENQMDEILEYTNISKKKWLSIDSMCDKCFLSGKLIYEYETKFAKVVSDIYENDSKVYEALGKILK